MERVQSSDAEEQIANLMESALDPFETTLPSGYDEEMKLSKASSLLMKAIHIVATSRRAPSGEQKLITDYIQTKVRRCSSFVAYCL